MTDTPIDIFKKPLLHFDAFGSRERVMANIDAYVPRIFPSEAPNFIDHLKELINKYADQHGWETIAVSLSKGLAREELDELIEKETPHTGPLIIDPTAHSPEYHTFTSAGLLSARKERLISLNESTDDILIVIYGIENVNASTQRALLMKRMRILGLTAEHASEELEAAAASMKAAGNPRITLVHKHAAKLRSATEKLKDAHKKLGMGGEAQIDLDNEEASGNMFLAIATIHMLLQETADPQLRATLQGLSSQILSIPTHYENAGITFNNYENAVNHMIEVKNDFVLAPNVRADGDAHMDNKAQLRPAPAPR